MLRRSTVVGIVEIELSAGETFLFERFPIDRFSLGTCRHEFPGRAACAVLAADLPRLHADLDSEFRRLQARLAA